MALPANVGLGTVTCSLSYSTGIPVQGTIDFTPEFDWLKSPDSVPPVFIVPTPRVLTLVNGAGTIQLIATDDLDLVTHGWTYSVLAKFDNGVRLPVFSISVPEGVTQDLASLAPESWLNLV